MRVVLSVLAVASALAQDRPIIDVLLDAKRPSVYIEFDRAEGGPGGAMVWLRLHNNSRGAISIRTESVYIGQKVRPLTLKNGEGVLAMKHGAEIAPCYSIEGPAPDTVHTSGRRIDERPYQRLPLGSACTVGGTSWVASGESVLLRIPTNHLAPQYRLSVPFEYEWEPAKNIEHRVLFAGAEVP
jgi:hypothetical protein